MNFLTNNKGFFQGGKSLGGKGFIEPMVNALKNIKPPEMMGGGQSQQDPNAPTQSGMTPMMTEEQLMQLHPEWFGNAVPAKQINKNNSLFLPQQQQQRGFI